MVSVQCKKCLKKFQEKDIYTIQQFQYRNSPSYEWTQKYFTQLKIGEWDSFCADCLMNYKKISEEDYLKTQD